LLADVKAFEKASLAGEFYRSFSVNSRNSMEKSSGTLTRITKFLRMLADGAAKAKKGDSQEVRESMDILFGLLNYINRGYPEIVFFADEAGSWQVGVDWAKILPVWFTVLSATAEPDEYSQRVVAMVSRHYNYGRAEMLRIARRVATLSRHWQDSGHVPMAEPLSVNETPSRHFVSPTGRVMDSGATESPTRHKTPLHQSPPTDYF
jgi:hypothetical protein